MLTARCLDHLAADANAIARLAQTTLDHVANAEFSGELLRIGPFALVSEAGVARHDREPARPRELGDQILGDAIEEELGLGIAAGFLEGRPRARRFFRWCCGLLASWAFRRGRRLVQHDAEGADRARDVLDLV